MGLGHELFMWAPEEGSSAILCVAREGGHPGSEPPECHHHL